MRHSKYNKIKINSLEEFAAGVELDQGDCIRAYDASEEVWREIIAAFPQRVAWIAYNPHLPVEIIEELSHHPDPRTRCFIASKRRTPAEILLRLATDVREDVRGSVVNNRKAPKQVLEVLKNDPVKRIRDRAIERLTEGW